MTLGDFFLLERYFPNQYVRALLVFIIVFLVLRIVLAILQRVTLRLTSKTKTDIDDRLIKRSSTPLTLVAFFVSLRTALEELILTESLELNIYKIIYSVLIILVGYLIFIFVDIVLLVGWKKLASKSKVKVNESLTSLVHEVLKITLILLVLLYILEIWGIKIIPILGALGIAGIAVALALQPVLSNIFSGISIILDKSIRVGDWVVFDDGTQGVIEKIGIRSTKVRSFDNEMIVVPNTKLADNKIQNVSQPEPKVRVVIPFGVAYGSKIEHVKKIVLNEIKKIRHVVEPAPVVRFLEMGASSLNFKAFFYVDSFENRYQAIDDANTTIYNALNKAGISIPFPQMDVHIKEFSDSKKEKKKNNL